MTPRVAFFTDCFHEVNGVALTSQEFARFAHRRRLPFLTVHSGPAERLVQDGSVTTLELDTSLASVPLDADLRFDLLFLRWRERARKVLNTFRPDLVHITSPGHVGLLGALLASDMRVPLVASWHTNVHEFGARRLESLLWFLPEGFRRSVSDMAEGGTLNFALRFYRIAKLLFAPNDELVRLLKGSTRAPVELMRRGVSTDVFRPELRDRSDDSFVLGFVGRIRPEKNVRFLAAVERQLLAAGHRNFRFVIIGQGTEREWLEENLQSAEFPGVLKGEPLARAYANMDLFVFPSQTDTFGNVVQEALASGVPAVVTHKGGPKYLVNDGENGFIASTPEDFCQRVSEVMRDAELHSRMRQAARQAMLERSWDNVFEKVYHSYRLCLSS